VNACKMLSRILGRHTLARMKKREHVRTKEKKSKMDKKDDITITLFFFSIFLIILFSFSP
jgi:hypothetical protein